MTKDRQILEINRTINMLMAHPDNEPNSEFEDRIESLIELKKQLTLSNVSNRRELLRDYEKFTDPDQNMKDAEQNIAWFLGE